MRLASKTRISGVAITITCFHRQCALFTSAHSLSTARHRNPAEEAVIANRARIPTMATFFYSTFGMDLIKSANFLCGKRILYDSRVPYFPVEERGMRFTVRL